MKNKENDSSARSAESGHDPLSFVTGLGAKLATRSRHVCVLLGAGTANACGLPDVGGIGKRILEKLEAEDKEAFELQLSGRSLEEALSRIRRISALLGSGEDTVDGLTAERANKLDNTVCRIIVEALRIKNAENLTPVYCLAAWVARANYHQPVELFTLNYDLLLETALEKMRAPYFDGFIGTLEARFDTELSEAPSGPNAESMPAFFARLWKLHGSVNWAWNDDREIVRLGYEVPAEADRTAAIYPSDAKYEESRRVPFVVLQDIFRKTLHQPETLVMITGYSFGDDHINEQLFHAATRRQRSEFMVFCFGEIPEKLAVRAFLTPNLQVVSGSEAILGGKRADWKPPEPEDLPGNLSAKIWESGKFALCDFRNLAAYLARSTTVGPDGMDTAIKDLLNEVKEKSGENDY